MKDMYAFINLCINQYVLEVAKERLKEDGPTISFPANLHCMHNNLLSQILTACEPKDNETFYMLFEEAIYKINTGTMFTDSDFKDLLKRMDGQYGK